jgi:hypothetical protein
MFRFSPARWSAARLSLWAYKLEIQDEQNLSLTTWVEVGFLGSLDQVVASTLLLVKLLDQDLCGARGTSPVMRRVEGAVGTCQSAGL